MQRVWSAGLAECFQPAEDNPAKLVNAKMEEIRTKLIEYKRVKVEAGRAGGRKSAQAKRVAEPKQNSSSASILLQANDQAKASSSSSSSSLEEEILKKPLPAGEVKKAAVAPRAEATTATVLSVRGGADAWPARRAPRDFVLTAELLLWAHGEGFDEITIAKRTEAFMDHEFEKPRQDWAATWRNWMRDTHLYGGRNHGHAEKRAESAAERAARIVREMSNGTR